MNQRHPAFFLVFLIALSVAVLPALAQSGRVTGTVFDQSRGTLPGATVTAINEGTSIEGTFLTDDTGRFDFPGLIPGRYLIRAELQGFKTAQARVVVEVAQVVRQDLTLTVGEIPEIVTIEAEAALLQKDQAELGQVVNSLQMVELPLNGRQFTQLATLATGVIQHGQRLQMQGSRPGLTRYEIDGIPTDSLKGGDPVVFPSVDSIQEFKLQSSTFSAEYGRAPGLLNVTTKSGTNQFNGTVYDFWRNDSLAANDFFQNQRDNPQQARLNRHQFGATLGGPLIREKTFFFTSYEGQKRSEGESVVFRAPTDLERAGDFSQSPGVKVVLDPLSKAAPGGPYPFNPFPGKKIPAERIHPVYKYFESWYPSPNDSTGLLVITSPVRVTDAYQFSARLDHHLSKSDQVYGRIFHARSDSESPGWGARPNLIGGTNVEDNASQFGLHWTHAFSPRLLTEVHYSFVDRNLIRQSQQTGFKGDQVTDHLTESGIGGMAFHSSLFPGPPSLNFTQQFPYDLELPFNPQDRTDRFHGIKSNMAWIYGRHTLKTGIDLLKQKILGATALYNRGEFKFTGLTTLNANPWADFILGFPTLSQRLMPDLRTGARRDTYHFFVQDDFKITSNLTLNLGVRYEYNIPAEPILGGAAIVDALTGQIIFSDYDGSGKPNGTNSPGVSVLAPLVQGSLMSTTEAGLKPSFYRGNDTNLAPRIGLAWSPWGGRTVIRLGYGVYYLLDTLTDFSLSTGNNPPFNLAEAVNNQGKFLQGKPLTPINATFLPFEDVTRFNFLTATVTSIDPDFKTPYENQFSLSIQRQLNPTLVFETAYVGKTGLNLQSKTLQPVAESRPAYIPANAVVLGQKGKSAYHSWQSRLEKRYSQGVSVLASYTWSKVIDTGSNATIVSGTPSSRKAVADFDIPHRLVISSILDVPVGRGRRWLSGGPGWSDAILGGWQLNAISQLQSGRVFSLQWAGGDTTIPTNPLATVPDRICDGRLDNPTLDRWFDTKCFVPHYKPANPNQPGTYLPEEGNAGRNVLRADGKANFDVGIMKTFFFGSNEEYRLQFRAEMFNAFNHPEFKPPNTSAWFLGGSSIGFDGTDASAKVVATSQEANPRQVQFALKLYF